MEEQLAAGLGKGQIAELVEDDEVEPGQVIGQPPLAAGAGFGVEPVDQVDHVEEPAAALAGATMQWTHPARKLGSAQRGNDDASWVVTRT
jgi:hypothetical protein